MAGKGRPVGSKIRDNIVEILYFLGSSYGYDIYKIYRQIFPNVTMRSIYYHLQKGCDTGEIKIEKVEKVKGDFSWGSEVQKVFYSLGDNANPRMDTRVKDFFDKQKEE